MSRSASVFDQEAFVRALRVSRETAERFEVWRALLDKWNAKINLVAPSTLADFWRRHALDGAQIFDLAPDAQVWADLGSGAGVPGLAVALMALDRGIPARVHLIEANVKKASFLREAARTTGATVKVHARRIEACDDLSGTVDVVTARALASLDALWPLARPLMKPEGRALFLKGREVDREFALATDLAREDRPVSLLASLSDPEARIVRIGPPASPERAPGELDA